MSDKIKMYVIFAMESVRKMNGNRGKLAAQAGHGYLHSSWDAADRFPEMLNAYRDSSHAYKIALAVETVDELEKLHEAYRDICGVSLVKDAGFTVFSEPTVTCLGIGPIPESLMREDLKSLPTMK